MNNIAVMAEQNGSICEKNKKARNGKIEFLRFLFAVIIVFHHSRSFLGDEISPFLGGSLAVEFFFFVSGYLMMASIDKKNKLGKPQYIGRETIQYVGKKWVSVLPESIISWIIAFCIMCPLEGRDFESTVFRFIDGIWEPIFITMTGLGQRGMNGVVWYISAMLICMMILYPLLRKYPDVTLHILIPLISLCIFGCFFRNSGSVRNPTKWLGWTYRGVLRAFAEIGIGCWLFYLSRAISKNNYTRKGRLVISTVENIMYIMVIYFMYIMGANKHDYFFVALMAIAVALTFSGAGIDAELFNNKIVMWLGRFSVPLYFSHIFWGDALNYFVPLTFRIRYSMAIYFALSCATALIVMKLSSEVRKSGPIVLKKIREYLIKDAI